MGKNRETNYPPSLLPSLICITSVATINLLRRAVAGKLGSSTSKYTAIVVQLNSFLSMVYSERWDCREKDPYEVFDAPAI